MRKRGERPRSAILSTRAKTPFMPPMSYNLHWMPTLMSDTQMVLPVEKVMYQAQEVAAVVATDRCAAADGADAVEVDCDPLPVVVDPKKALEPGAPVLRTDKKDKHDNHIWHWGVGDRAGTERAFAEAEVVVAQDLYIPRIHVASIETCGCVADFDRVNGKLTVYMTTQAPHALAVPSVRCQGRWRVGHRRGASGHRQRRRRRPRPSRSAPHLHPHHAREGLEHPQGEGGR